MSGAIGGGGTNPSDAASEYLNKIPGTIKPYYDPYINTGKEAMGDLQSQYKQLLSDPTFMMSLIGGKYKASPGYQWNVDQATTAANNAAQAGGMVGSPQEQQELAKAISGIASQDYNTYMNQGLGLYNTGLGVAGDLNKIGYGASSELANSLMSTLMSQASNAFSGAQYNNNKSGGLWGSLAGFLGGGGGSGLSNLFGGSGGGGYGMSAADLTNYLSPGDFF